jgi:hypothetical protein
MNKTIANLNMIRVEMEVARIRIQRELRRLDEQIEGLDVIMGMANVRESDLIMIRNLL